ncbi:kinase-like protein [Atractiella rhizophila]|nr:kinase-like protein [Atractiella rhizophila]
MSISSVTSSDSSSSDSSSSSENSGDVTEEDRRRGGVVENGTVQEVPRIAMDEGPTEEQTSPPFLGKITQIGRKFPSSLSAADTVKTFALTDTSQYYRDSDESLPPSPVTAGRKPDPSNTYPPPTRPANLPSLSAASLTSSKQMDPTSVFSGLSRNTSLTKRALPSSPGVTERKGVTSTTVGFSPAPTPSFSSSPAMSRASSAVPLPTSTAAKIPLVDSRQPIDPQMYSAVTGARSVDDFILEGEAGKGAYGLVRRGREKGIDGEPVGPLVIIKYIIKQRILADCWKRHKTLGPIPVEIHVLDYLRRVPYTPPPTTNTRSQPRKSSYPPGAAPPPVENDVLTGHPSICSILDFFEDADYYYLVMPLSQHGRDLFDYVESYPEGLPVQEIKNIFSQIADAVRWLHSIGVVHRDIKDENVVLDGENGLGGVKLIDFGSAAYIREGRKFDTFSGTLDFAAPEVLKGERYGGKETDVWALGVLLYVLIVGECPFYAAEEVQDGVREGTRGLWALKSKIKVADPQRSGSASSSPILSPTGGLPDPAPGSGTMRDAVDLCARCLEVVSTERPSTEEIMIHAFFRGNEGWRGHKGWALLPPV